MRDSINTAKARIAELDRRIKQLDKPRATKPKSRRGGAGDSFDKTIVKSIQRMYPKRGSK